MYESFLFELRLKHVHDLFYGRHNIKIRRQKSKMKVLTDRRFFDYLDLSKSSFLL